MADFWCVCMYSHTLCAHTCYLHVEARGQNQVSSSITFYLEFQDSISH